LIDPELVGRTEPITVQFSPFSQILDGRARRRLVRSGLSEEMNRIDSEKKDLKKAAAKIESLHKKLNSLESARASGFDNSSTLDENFETMPIGDDTIDETMLMSDSPTFHRYSDAHGLSSGNSTSPEDLSPVTPHTGFTHPVSIMGDQSPEELRMMAEDLAAVRKEKQDLFNEWRKLNPPSTTEPEGEATAPPADFMKQIVPRLEAALRTESDLTQALKTIQDELIQMGFSGPNINAILSQMHETFQSAGEELKHIRSGETESARSSVPANGKEILEHFIKRFRQVSNAICLEHQRAESLAATHNAIKRQFDNTIELLRTERDKVKKMEESKETDAEDMIHVRMKLQEVQQELEEKETSFTRLNETLKKYYEDEKDHHKMIEQLEEQLRDEQRISEQRKQRTEELEPLVTRLTDRTKDQEKKIEEFKLSWIDQEKKLEDLKKNVQGLAEENQKLIGRIAEREQKIGRLNARYAEASTELQSAQADLANAQQLNKMLGAHNREQIAARNRIENFLKASMTECLKTFDVERENDRKQQITENTLSNDHGSEPSLPTNSPFKTSRNGPLENVRLGRGKDHRTLFSSELGLDSGIGPSEPQTDAPAGSDAFLEAIDEEDQNIE
jgi:hypothetical protein